jgi:hypothetical protein
MITFESATSKLKTTEIAENSGNELPYERYDTGDDDEAD